MFSKILNKHFKQDQYGNILFEDGVCYDKQEIATMNYFETAKDEAITKSLHVCKKIFSGKIGIMKGAQNGQTRYIWTR